MRKRIIALLCMLVISCTIISPAYAVSENVRGETYAEDILYFTDFSELTQYTSIETLVVSEAQMIQLGSSVKDLFDYTNMVYILTTKSVAKIQEVCEIDATISSDDINANKYATIVELTDSGEYVFNNISAIYNIDDSVACISADEIEGNVSQPSLQMIEDGLDAFLTTKSNQFNTYSRTQASGFSAYATDSAVLYDGQGGRIGTMGYTTYWYKVVKSGDVRIFDVICVATFAPDSNYYCKKMSVYLGTSFDNHEILEASNIVSSGQTYTHSLSLSAGKDGLEGGYGTSWAYTVGAQDVVKSFDMTTNDRTWTFKPIDAAAGDAWIEEPGIRMCSTQERCHTTVTISCPKLGLFNIVTNKNEISTNWFFTW